MSREAAGAAIRALRESRQWSLADLAAATGVSVMGLSYLERGARKPHKSTVQKVEIGLGLPPGSYSRLALSEDPDALLAELLAAETPEPAAVRVDRNVDVGVLQGYARAQLDALRTVIARLPPKSSNEYETYIRSVMTQCATAELLAADSWRVAVNAGSAPEGPLLECLRELDRIRVELVGRLPDGLPARFEAARLRSGLPDRVIAALLGVDDDELWRLRTAGVVPPGAARRIQDFIEVWRSGQPDR
ncbi:helix-turn-helix domain-containing protein [Mycolicibacterium fallax]|uniref:Transcriptional regulator n=1 Tax=Mycolicibacterium fallax TaxID=1793 RepID=A0A1X1RJ63_MYCFA|nr:helix-turn-helix transcriptional regulator [Mycolicibacterium fallax]ORV07644.1 transcriptional regulator [Mycolicibacterium fallax]BBY99308.1 putative HTH-type transcriptional regulator [Mycolicibacterium fallax]HOW93199.1 helix-turn-helix transcriptional regulator [Mycolicibacterium fallax]HSA41092.1 helix-turn-helix transcriptional regulator [Mycobacterium sp.]